VFSPENAPIENHIRDMVEIITGKNFYGYYNTEQITDDEIVKAMQFIDNSVLFYHPNENDALKIENLLSLMVELRKMNMINAFVLDPYNEFSPTRDSNQSETEYVSHFLQKTRRVTTDYGMSALIVAHPTKIKKDELGKYLVPTAYDISGSANWYNKADTIICIHRDKDRETNPDNITEVYIQKLKRKDWGTLGMYELQFNQGNNTYTKPPKYSDIDMPDYGKQYSSK
jgi:twinkle protein